MTFISRGVTADSETHYRGITTLFSSFVPIPTVITAVAVTVSSTTVDPFQFILPTVDSLSQRLNSAVNVDWINALTITFWNY